MGFFDSDIDGSSSLNEEIQAYNYNDLMEASQEYTERVEITTQERRAIENLVSDRNRRYEKISGKNIDDEIRNDIEFSEELNKLRPYGIIDKPIIIGTQDPKITDLYIRFVDKQIKNNPEIYKNLLTREQIQEKVYSQARESYRNYVEVSAGAPDDWKSFFYDFYGSLKGQSKDPFNWQTLTFGGVGKTVLKQAFLSFGEGVVTESIQQGLGLDFKKRAGIPQSLEQTAQQVAASGLISGLLGGFGKALGDVFSKYGNKKILKGSGDGSGSGSKVNKKDIFTSEVINPDEINDTKNINKITTEVLDSDLSEPSIKDIDNNNFKGLEESEAFEILSDNARQNGDFNAAVLLDDAADDSKIRAFDLSEYTDDIPDEIHIRAVKEIEDAINENRPILSENIRLNADDLKKIPLEDSLDPRLRTPDARMRAHINYIKKLIDDIESKRAIDFNKTKRIPIERQLSPDFANMDAPIKMNEFSQQSNIIPGSGEHMLSEMYPNTKYIDDPSRAKRNIINSMDTKYFDNDMANAKNELYSLSDDTFTFQDENGKLFTKKELIDQFQSEKDFLDAVTLCGGRL